MSITERSYDPCRLVFEVYDHHKPPTGAYLPLEQPLAARPLVGFAMVGRGDRGQHGAEMRS